MALEAIVDQQAVTGVARQIAEQHRPMHRRQRQIGVPFVAQQFQAFVKIPGTEITESGTRARRREHGRGAQLDRLRLAPGERGTLRLVELRLRQIIDADVLAHDQPTIE